MTTTHDEIEQARQHAAERSPTSTHGTDAPGVRQYRQLYLALRELELPQAPDGFALHVERIVCSLAISRADETAEQWGVRLGLLALLGLLVTASMAFAAPLWRHWPMHAGHSPWQILLASAGILIAMGVLDHRQRYAAGGKMGVNAISP